VLDESATLPLVRLKPDTTYNRKTPGPEYNRKTFWPKLSS
jgi:hypothetical protein